MNMNYQKIKVNGVLYNCFEVSSANTSKFSAIIMSEDINEIKKNFSESDSIIVINNIGQIMRTVEGYTSIDRITEIPNYYMDDEGIMHSAIQIIMNPVDISKRIQMLESKLDTTVNEADMTLEEYKSYRIAQSKAELEEYLESHPITSTSHGGVEGVYSITKEKQDLMSQQYLTYQIAKQVSPETATLTWNEAGGICTEWIEEEFIQLIMEIKAKVYPLVSYQQEIEVKINESNDKAEIAALLFDYDNVPYENNDFFASNDSTPTDNSTDIPTDIEEPNNEPFIEESAEITE